MSKTDATKCATCGGEFSTERVVIDGNAYHLGCSVMSYGPHTHEDYARIGNKLWELYEAAWRFERKSHDLDDTPELVALRKALLETYDGWVYAPDETAA